MPSWALFVRDLLIPQCLRSVVIDTVEAPDRTLAEEDLASLPQPSPADSHNARPLCPEGRFLSFPRDRVQ
jgi:hypothetical protein